VNCRSGLSLGIEYVPGASLEWHTLFVALPASRRPGRPVAAKADETRRRIICAARQVFSERGYDGATFQGIAELASLTRPAINHYYSSKLELYTEVARVTNELVFALGIERARQETTLMARIAAFTTAAMEVDAEYPFTAAFLTSAALESQRHPEFRDVENEAQRIARDFLFWAINDSVESGELIAATDVSSLVEVLLLLLCGAAFYAGFVRSSQEMEGIIGSLRQLLTGSLFNS
jgi:TetR/AcrR family transcriptional repressor of uid operon